MTSRTTAKRLIGAVVMAFAIVPWLGAGSASAAATDDSNCATRPADVPAGATCVVLDENTGDNPALHGETWAWVDVSTNDLHVVAYPTDALSGTDPIQLCVRTSAPYPADFKCLGSSADRVYFGSSTHVVVDLDALGIAPGATVYYSIHVNQGGRTTVSSGAPGRVTPPPPPSSPPVTTKPPATTSAPAVAPTTAKASPSTSVQGAKNAKPPAVLPKTGSGMSLGTGLAISLGLLLGGAALMFGSGRVALAKGKRRRH